jgi:hypothetical protein
MILSLLFVASLAHAGNGHVIGNGGNTVSCPESSRQGQGIFWKGRAVLDVYEGRFGTHLHYAQLTRFRGQPLTQAFPEAVRLFLRHSPWRQGEFMDRFAKRPRQMHFIEETLPVRSYSWRAFFSGCQVEQVAMQYTPWPPNPNDELYLKVSAPLWRSLPTDQQVALLFHEYILKDHVVSEGTCAYGSLSQIVGYILSDEGSKAALGDWSAETNFHCYSAPDGSVQP